MTASWPPPPGEMPGSSAQFIQMKDPAPELPAPDEASLIKAAVSGNHEAFTHLVNHHQDRIFQACFRLLRCREEAKEVSQDVFLRAFQALPRYKPHAKFSTWLYQIALNRCRDSWKRPSRKITSESVPLDESGTALFSSGAHPGSAAGWSDEVRKLDRGLRALAPKHREVIILVCIEELSHAECALILKCSERAVEGRLHRARKALHDWW